MKDPEQIGGIFFFLLLGLSIPIAVLGVSVLKRLADGASLPQGRSPTLVTFLVLACCCVLSFLAIFTPFLALLPAGFFCIGGLRLNLYGGKMNRDGGIVVLLVGLHWIVLTAIQVALTAWQETLASATIRVDFLVTLPLTCLSAILGWMLLDRMPVDPNWNPQRKSTSLPGR